MTASRDRLLRVFLGWHAIVIGVAGVSLIVLPLRLVNSPSMSTIYRLAPPKMWGAAFMFIAAMCAIASWRLQWWRIALVGLSASEMAWALGLTMPLLLTGQLNVLAPIAWVGIAGTALIIGFATRDHRL